MTHLAAAGTLIWTMSTEASKPWPRPRPLIGDTTSSAERAGDPMSWALPATTRAALAEVIAARRDVRRFRPDPVGDDIIDEILAAGHAAPSVGHSQPWRFVVVRDPRLRASAAVMADRARLAQARQLDPDSARHLRSLQLERQRVDQTRQLKQPLHGARPRDQGEGMPVALAKLTREGDLCQSRGVDQHEFAQIEGDADRRHMALANSRDRGVKSGD